MQPSSNHHHSAPLPMLVLPPVWQAPMMTATSLPDSLGSGGPSGLGLSTALTLNSPLGGSSVLASPSREQQQGRALTRKPSKRNWQPYNDFDRAHFEAHGVRPSLQDTKKWFDVHQNDFVDVGNEEPPSWDELKIHRGRFRVDTARTRTYTNQRRAQKRAKEAKDKAQRTWRKIPALVRVLALCKSVRRTEEDMWRDFLAVFEKGKKSLKGYVLALMAVRRMKAAAEDNFVGRVLGDLAAGGTVLDAVAQDDEEEEGEAGMGLAVQQSEHTDGEQGAGQGDVDYSMEHGAGLDMRQADAYDEDDDEDELGLLEQY